MGFRVGAYAKVWEIEDRGKFSVVSLSTSKKDQQSGNYETDFNAKFARFIGQAHKDIQNLNNGVKIKLTEVEVTNKYVKEKGMEYTNYLVYGFEPADLVNNSSAQTTTSNDFVNIPDGIESEIPFL